MYLNKNNLISLKNKSSINLKFCILKISKIKKSFFCYEKIITYFFIFQEIFFLFINGTKRK